MPDTTFTAETSQGWQGFPGKQELMKKARVEKDISAQAILNLYSDAEDKAEKLSQLEVDLRDKIENLKKDEADFRRSLDDYKGELKKVNSLIIGALLFVSVTFIISMLTFFWGEILSNKSDKDLYLQYNELLKEKSDDSIEFSNKLNEQAIKINDLKNNIDVLKAKNSYLK